MEQNQIDLCVIVFSLIYNGFLTFIFILRANERSKIEIKLAPVFSLLILPIMVLILINFLSNSDLGRIGTLSIVLIFLIFDFYYRYLTKKKPVHHPDKWPIGLIIYLILYHAAGIALNGYGYIISRTIGHLIVLSYFVALGAFIYYQRKYNASKNKQNNDLSI